jgi:hypothetical protein
MLVAEKLDWKELIIAVFLINYIFLAFVLCILLLYVQWTSVHLFVHYTYNFIFILYSPCYMSSNEVGMESMAGKAGQDVKWQMFRSQGTLRSI